MMRSISIHYIIWRLHSFGHHTDAYVDEYIAETEHYTTSMAAQFVEKCQKEYMQASKKVN